MRALQERPDFSQCSVRSSRLGAISGCGPKDATLTAAPSTPPGANAPPPVELKQPRPRLPKLSGQKGGSPGGAGGI